VDTVASVRETTLRGKHRTEATEVTEEGIVVGRKALGDAMAAVRERDSGVSIAQRPQKSRRRELGWAKGLGGDAVAAVRERS
jgi:hypothetical protein